MKTWRKKEKRDEKDFQGRRTSGSGKNWYAKGDVKTKTFLIENKTTKHLSYSISSKLWDKIRREALMSQRIPLLSIELGDGTELIILDKSDYLHVLNVHS
jgi:hypothetical protein